MKVFVLGAAGFQGGNIAQALLADNHKVVTLKRDPAAGNPVAEGITVIKGDLEDTASLAHAMQGAKAAVYSFPLIFDLDRAKQYTENFIAAATQEKVELIIHNTTFYLAEEETGLLALDMKVAMEKLFAASGLKVITLTPNIYLDNIAAPWSVPVILEHKIVPYPISPDKKVPWISHTDLGKYVAKAVNKPELAGRTLPVGGNLITGPEIASAIGRKINEGLNYVPVPVDEFEQQLVPGFGPLAAKEISNLYRFIEDNYATFSAQDFAETNRLLGVTPQPLQEWVDSVNWN